ncbi:MAG TPA: helix-turn-helix transcriptional regulator [Acidimicrobiales bacterium]|jgi:DNA-binding CsgD family transcriptional regulator|nr:helix-turn-helix transcriptional regulator [Acidimicrobiales bacterium]
MAERLAVSDLAGILELVHALGEVGDPDEFLDVSLQGVMEIVPCTVATVNEVVPSADRVVGWTRPDSFHLPDGTPEALARLAGEHPLITHIATTGDGSAHRISDFWSQDEFHRTELYDVIYRPMGIEYQMAVGFPVPQPTVLGLTMNREVQDFSDRDVLALNTVRPHLVQGWRAVRDRRHMQALLDASEDAIAGQGTGLVVLWDQPQELTPGVLVTLYRSFGRPSRTSPFPARVARWIEAQAAQSRGSGLALSRPLTSQRDGRRVILRYLPARGSHPGAVVVTERPGSADRKGFESLGLTRREAEIVALVAEGSTNDVIATRLGLATATVKKHLENVYTKLGVHTRAQVVAFAFETLGAAAAVDATDPSS